MPVHAARSDLEGKLGEPECNTEEGRKKVLCLAYCSVFSSTGQVSLQHGLACTPTASGKFLGVKGRWGDVSKDPLALHRDISDREAAGMSQPEPGIAEFWSFSDTGFLWDLSFPVTLRGHVWEQEGAGTLLETTQRLRAPALPLWAVPIAVTPPALAPQLPPCL